MYNIKLDWKEFSVDLEAIGAWVKSIEPLCVGTSANSALEIHFSEEPSQETKDAVLAKWESLTAESVEVLSYRSSSDVQAAMEAMKQDLVVKTWDTMSIPERKMVMGMTVTKQDLIDAQLL